MVWSIAPFCLLVQDNSNKMSHGFYAHVIPVLALQTQIASSMAPLQLLVEDDQNGRQYDFFGHLTLLALTSISSDVNGIVNSTTAFIRSRWLKQCVIYLFLSFDAIDADVSVVLWQQYLQWHHCICWVKITQMSCNMMFFITSCHWHCNQYHVMLIESSITALHFLGQNDHSEVKHYFFIMMPLTLVSLSCDTIGITVLLVIHDTNGIIHGTTSFPRSRQLKWGAKWLFHHVMSLVAAQASLDADNVIIGTTAFLRSRGWLKRMAMRCNKTFWAMRCNWYWHHTTLMA